MNVSMKHNLSVDFKSTIVLWSVFLITKRIRESSLILLYFVFKKLYGN